jgi:hypothetical protein
MRVAPLAVVLLFASGCLAAHPDVGNATKGVAPRIVAGPDHAAFKQTQGRELELVADRTDPSRLTIAYVIPRESPVSSSWLSIAKSRDGGATWTTRPFCGDPLVGAPKVGTCFFAGARLTSDPVLMQAADGTLLYVGVMLGATDVTQFVARFAPDAMEPTSVHVVSRSSLNMVDGAQMLPAPYQVYYNGKANLMQARDGAIHLVWAADLFVDQTGTTVGLPHWTTSRDGGRTWSRPVDLSDAKMGDPDAIYAVGVQAFQTLDGRLHAIWWESKSNALYQVDSDDGVKFTAVRKIAPAMGRPPQAMVNSDNMTRPWLVVDGSSGPHAGSAYLLFDDLSLGDRDLYLLVSRDGATTWSAPQRLATVPERNGRDETMARPFIDRDGTLSILYPSWKHLERWSPYEMRLATSFDGARTFQDILLSSDFSPINNPGDYNDLDRTKDGLLAVWEDGRGGPDGTKWLFESLIRTA